MIANGIFFFPLKCFSDSDKKEWGWRFIDTKGRTRFCELSKFSITKFWGVAKWVIIFYIQNFLISSPPVFNEDVAKDCVAIEIGVRPTDANWLGQRLLIKITYFNFNSEFTPALSGSLCEDHRTLNWLWEGVSVNRLDIVSLSSSIFGRFPCKIQGHLSSKNVKMGHNIATYMIFTWTGQRKRYQLRQRES